MVGHLPGPFLLLIAQGIVHTSSYAHTAGRKVLSFLSLCYTQFSHPAPEGIRINLQKLSSPSRPVDFPLCLAKGFPDMQGHDLVEWDKNLPGFRQVDLLLSQLGKA